MTSIMGQIIQFTFNAFNIPLPWDDYSFTLLEVLFAHIQILLCAIFVWRVLLFYARKYDL